MLLSVAINGTLCLAMEIAAMFCLGDVDAVLNTPTGYPIIAIFSQALRSTGGTSVLVRLLLSQSNQILKLVHHNRQP